MTTAGVYQRAKRVMKASVFAFLAAEFSTSSKILETVDSSNGRLTRICSRPVRLMQPLRTSSPGFASRGSGSPVRAEVLTLELPSSTVPSSGIFSPGRTAMVSPTCTSSGSTRRRLPSSSRLA